MDYEKQYSVIARMVHKRLAQWLQKDVGLATETATDIEFIVNTPRFIVKITYLKGKEVYRLNIADELLQNIELINVEINAFMVGEIFTKRRLQNALAIFN